MRTHLTDDIGATAGGLLVEGMAGRERPRLAIPGGGSPTSTFAWLAENWDGTHAMLTWVDERHLPLGPESSDWRDLPPQSNLKAAMVGWLTRTDRPPPWLPMTHPGTLDEAVASFTFQFETVMGGLDAVLLGMGPDGHIASLFPGHAALRGTRSCIGIEDSPKPPRSRLTLSLPVLAKARVKVLICTGSAKGAALARSMTDASMPLFHLKDGLDVVLDAEAARELP